MVWLETISKKNLIKGFKMLKMNDLILSSDLDEIPNLKNLNFSK